MSAETVPAVKLTSLQSFVIIQIGPDADVGISQRVISEEPMYIILNLGLSDSFQTVRGSVCEGRHLSVPI